jgi:hypothetical protein
MSRSDASRLAVETVPFAVLSQQGNQIALHRAGEEKRGHSTFLN